MSKASAQRNLKLIEERYSRARIPDKDFYTLRSLMGYTNKAIFFILLGGRDYGKSYSVMNQFLHDWVSKGIPFYWVRLNEASIRKLLIDNADQFIDPDLRRSYGLKLKTVGNSVYDVTGGKRRKMAEVIALSTFYNDKGVAKYDKDFLKDMIMHYNVCCDEFQPEKDQKSQGDVAYQFVNQMENIVRDSKQPGRVRIFLCANTLEEASDVLCLFDYIPEEFGRYWIPTHKAVIDYMEPTEKYLKRRKGTVADLLMPKASTFTNTIDIDKTLITGKKRLIRPTAVIRFYKGEEFTVWDSNVISAYHGEKVPLESWIAMRPYQDLFFDTSARDAVVNLFDTRSFRYKHLINMKQFQKCIQALRPRK